jgi:hypothetical protein
MDSRRILILISAVLAFLCLFLGLQLYQKSETIEAVETDNASLTLERDQVLFDLEKLRFSYDTLSTENALMLAEIADQRTQIDKLVTRVKNGNWELGKVKKEAETLRSIMKGYVAMKTTRCALGSKPSKSAMPIWLSANKTWRR